MAKRYVPITPRGIHVLACYHAQKHGNPRLMGCCIIDYGDGVFRVVYLQTTCNYTTGKVCQACESVPR